MEFRNDFSFMGWIIVDSDDNFYRDLSLMDMSLYELNDIEKCLLIIRCLKYQPYDNFKEYKSIGEIINIFTESINNFYQYDHLVEESNYKYKVNKYFDRAINSLSKKQITDNIENVKLDYKYLLRHGDFSQEDIENLKMIMELKK